MKITQIYIHYLSTLGLVFKKPTLLITSFSLLALTSLQMAIILLLTTLLIDYITGVYASYYIHKREGKKDNAWFSSDKSRLSFVKSITYFLLILLTYGIERIFKIKTFKLESYSHLEMSITLFAIAMCIAIEVYSTFWENLPRAGFNFPGKVVKVAKSFWELFAGLKK